MKIGRWMAGAFTAICVVALAAWSGPEGVEAGPDGSRLLLQKLDVDGNVLDTIEVMFNPKEYTIEKSTPWQEHHAAGVDAPGLEFTSGATTLHFDLDFDTGAGGPDVRTFVERVSGLSKADAKRGRPPTVLIEWGNGLRFRGLLTHVSERYTLFNPDGVPTRAKVSTTWKEYTPAEEQRKGAPRH